MGEQYEFSRNQGSQLVKDMVIRMLSPEPNERPTAAEFIDAISKE